MKRILLALTMLIGFSAAPQLAKAQVSVDFFYNNLEGGNWIETGDYGYVWQPDVAVNNDDWRPYSDGYWAYTDEGWTWVSYEDFGWATYHYGRWARFSDMGWVWVPGRNEDLEWGPAWVSWRTGGEYVGWAPLPPAGEPIYEGRAITGQVDVEFDIGPSYYNFVDVRYIGEPVLRERILPFNQNITYVNQTVNVTNITYKNKTVYNYGPDINVINQHSSRPIQRLKIERQNNVDFVSAAKSGGLKTQVKGQNLVVAAPAHISKTTQQGAPPNVKTKVAKANIDRGWKGVGDEKAQQEFKQRLRKQDRNSVQQATANTAVQGGTSPIASPAAGAPVGTDANAQFGKGGRHNRNRPEASVGTNAAVGTSPAAASTETNAGVNQGRGGKHRNRQGEQNATGALGASPAATIPATANAPAGPPATDLSNQGRGMHNGRRANQIQNAPAGATGVTATPNTESATGNEPAGQGKGKNNRRNQTPPGMENQLQGQPNNGAPVGQGQGQGQLQGQGQGREERRARRLEQQQQQQPQPQQGGATVNPQSQGQGQERHDGGKKNKGETTPVPTPQ